MPTQVDKRRPQGHPTSGFFLNLRKTWMVLRNYPLAIVPLLVALLLVAGCAKTSITDREQLVKGPLPRPAHIWIYDFAATPAELPAYSTLDDKYSTHGKPQTAEHIAIGRQLGAEIERELVYQIRSMGLPAEHAMAGTKPEITDLVIQGYIISFDEGDAKKRVGIGLRSGSSALQVAVEGFQMTSQGMRKLGSGSTDAGGAKTPGAAVGAATSAVTQSPAGLIISTGMRLYGEKSGRSKVEGRASQTAKEIADVLKERFREEGWIN